MARFITILSLSFLSLFGDSALLYKYFINQSFYDAKNAITVGATSATAKGYMALTSNPAGLSSNKNISLYARTTYVDRKVSENSKEFKPGNQIAGGLLYDFIGIEYKNSDYATLGAAYGFESKYGLFSLGASYTKDLTDVTVKDETGDYTFATGDFYTAGLMWQKTFISADSFYTIYFGVYQKASSNYTGTNDKNIIPLSPKKLSYGIGLETNLYSTSILLTVDKYSESFKSSPDTLDGLAYGLKWHIFEKLGIGAGYANETTNTALGDIKTVGAGIETGFWIFHINVAATNRKIDNMNFEENGVHLDIATVF